MSSRLVVLGSCGAWPEAGRACSGFVLEHEGFRVVLDLGYGTFPRLLSLLDSTTADGVDAVVITHVHPDHMVDLHALFRARLYGMRDAPAISLYSPRGVPARIAALEEGDDEAVGRIFDWHELPSRELVLGPFRLDSVELPHYVCNAGIRLSAADLVVAYTGDTGPSDVLADLGRDADLFIVDSTDLSQRLDGAVDVDEPAQLLTARQAGAAAAAASAKRLLLTHFWPGNDRLQSQAEAAEHFSGKILVAEEGLEIHFG